MILSDISIKRPVFAWMMMAALILFGGLAFTRLGISLMPDVDFPVVSISVTYAGASPQIMETDVVDFIEDAVMGVEGVRSVTSNSRDGVASISVEFELNRNIDVALQEVQTKISQAQRLLPKDIDPPVITKTNPEDQPIIWLALKTTGASTRDAMSYVHDYLKDEFSTVSGVGNIVFGGYVDPNLRVWVRKRALARYSLTAQDVMDTIQNEHVEVPAGYVQDKKEQHTVRTLGEAKSAADFRLLRVNSRGGGPNFAPIPIIKVAEIEDNLADLDHLSRSNGVFAVGLGIIKQRGTNAVDVAHAVRKKLAEINQNLPKGMALGIRIDNTKYIEDSVNELKFTLLLSALLTGLVCWGFLGSWTAALNVWLAIPTSIIGAFLITYFFGFTLNTFTLIALSLAIGIVVDDAIMVLENIVRHQEAGEERVTAALRGSREITFAATAASIAIVAIFLPVAFMTGIIGKYFYQFSITITAAVLLSLFEALTLTPMRASQFVAVSGRRNRFSHAVDEGFKGLREWYKKALTWSLNHRALVVWGSVIFFVLTFMVGKTLRTEFVPPQDQSLYLIRLQTPAWASFGFTNEKSKAIEDMLLKRPEVLGVFSAVGGFGGGGVNNASSIFVTMKPKGQRGTDPRLRRELSQTDSMGVVRGILKQMPDVKASIQDLSLRGFATSAGFPIEFTISGPDWDTLGKYTNQIMDELGKSGLMTDINTNYLLGMTEYDIVPDRGLAAAHGVSFGALAQNVSILVGGLKAGTFERAGHRYDVKVKMTGLEHTKADMLTDVYVRNNRGELVPLKDVTRIEERPALQNIYRTDRQRATTIAGNVAAGKSQEEVTAKAVEIAGKFLPGGYHLTFTGNSKAFAESFQSLIFALLLGIVVAYMILASQFNSYVDPLVVLIALPFSFSGAFLAMYLTGRSLNIFSMIGFILLMGIVKKNSILLVDFTNQMRERGMSIREALLEACPIRLRPILMTSTATIAGAIPAAIAFGPGSETRTPMAIAVIGGLLVSTLLTLFVVPCVYSLIGHRHENVVPLEEIGKE
jgi:hydrophobe/amphiphile efflux-1 (HAE1) family protein